jgi:hypothetical protein
MLNLGGSQPSVYSCCKQRAGISFTILPKLIPLKTKLHFGFYRAKVLLDYDCARLEVDEDLLSLQVSHVVALGPQEVSEKHRS